MDEAKKEMRGRPRLVEIELLRNYQPVKGPRVNRGETCKLAESEATDLVTKGVAKKL